MVRKRLTEVAQVALGSVTGDASLRQPASPPVALLEQTERLFPQARPNPFLGDGSVVAVTFEELTFALRSNDADVRAEAAEALGHLGDTRALRPLRGLLVDSDGEVRAHAAVAMIRVGDEVLLPEVVKALRHLDPRVVVGAAVALGRLRDLRTVPNLVEAFKTTNVEVGAAVAWALGQCGDAAALPWLMTAVEQGFAAANACEALGRIGDHRAQAVLISALGAVADDVRAYAARALGLLRPPEPRGGVAARTAQLHSQRAVGPLRALLRDRSRKVRLCAALSLYELGEKSVGRELVAVVEDR